MRIVKRRKRMENKTENGRFGGGNKVCVYLREEEEKEIQGRMNKGYGCMESLSMRGSKNSNSKNS